MMRGRDLPDASLVVFPNSGSRRSSMRSNTGPSLHTNFSLTAQDPQIPMPHFISLSSAACPQMPRFSAVFATDSIIGSGPQQ
jgi:hypothetical protein